MRRVHTVRILFKNITFDLEKFTAVAIEENNNSLEVAIYLERSRHVVYRLKNLKTADEISIKLVELVKFFYDQAIGYGFRAIDKDTTSIFGESFIYAENGLEELLKDFLKSFKTNEDYLKAKKNLDDYTEKISSGEEFSLDTLDDLVENVDDIVKKQMVLLKSDIKRLFS